MKITLIQSYFHNVWESLWAGYLKSYCDKNLVEEHEWNFYHGNFDSDEEIIKDASKSNVVAFSCTTPTFKRGHNLAKKIRERSELNPIIVFGGWHPSTAKVQIDNVINGVFFGEGEKAFCHLLKNVNMYRHRYLEEKKEYNVIPIQFNELPWPNRDFIHQNKFLDLCEEMCGERIISFQSRRGCMMNCSMCGERCMSGKGVRIRDNADLLDEIEFSFDRYAATMFKFVDPTWSYPKSHAKDFCEQKIKRNTFKWEAMAHASYLDKNLINLMAESNCLQMNIGCESGSQRVLNEIRKGTTIQQIKRVFKWGKDAGIKMRAFFMIGLERDMKEVEMTKQLIRDISPDLFGLTILCPYPGTDYYKDEFENEKWEDVDEYNSFWSTKYFSNEGFKQIQKDINKEFHHILIGHQKDNI